MAMHLNVRVIGTLAVVLFSSAMISCNQEKCPDTPPIVQVRGQVLGLADNVAVVGALVQAMDVNGAPVGTTGVTDENGNYSLDIAEFVDEDGLLIDNAFTLRVQAQRFQEFPTDIRPALPIDTTDAVEETVEFEAKIQCQATVFAIENALTTVLLIALPGNTSALGSISGNVMGENNEGILVVAEGAAGAFTGYSDTAGKYTIFNVPTGAYTVNGYALGVQFIPANTSLGAGEIMTDVNLNPSADSLSNLSGNVQLVNPGTGSLTSVVLALESTFSDVSGRGKVPPGLRVGGVTGAFSIEAIPNGTYVVLAAFENDFLVRDPDQNIGGTELVTITLPDAVQGNNVVLPEGFKVTGALEVVSPGADGPEEITDLTPTFQWAEDSSEDGYEIWVLDSFGNELWRTEIPGVSGSSVVSLTYAGPALEPGIFYQFRVESFRERSGGRSAISATEDLKGVFFIL